MRFLTLFIILLLPELTQGAACLGDSLSFRRLPATVGKPFSNLKVPLHMPCDTMVIEKTDTTRLYPGSMLHFGPNSSPKNIIVVKGTLITLGNDHEPVYLSGSIEEGSFGLRPGASPWGGIQVRPTGSVSMRKTRIFNATSALTSESPDIVFSKVYLKGSLNVMPPWKEPVTLDYSGTTVDTLNFSEGRDKDKSATTPLPPVTKAQGSNSSQKKSNPLLWGTLGVGAIAAGTGIWLWTQSSSPPSPNPSLYPADPSLPDEPETRGP